MPLKTKPDDKPSPVRFCLNANDDGLRVTCSLLPQASPGAYEIQEGSPCFADRDAFKNSVVKAGMSPSAAEDTARSFNATARQLRELGFSVHIAEQQS